jgi:hypothetical protein
LREIAHPVSIIAIAALGAFGLLVYVIGYAIFGAGRVERQLGRDVWRSAIHFTRLRFRHARSDT